VVAGKTRWMKIEAVPRLLRDGKTVYEGVMIDITSHNEALDALNRTHARIAQATIAQSRLLEREQLLQDMHDGFGSQLATARLMAEKGDLQPHELADILQQCMSDLLLFTDTLRNGDCNLADGLFDLRYRTVQRTAHLPLTWQWLIRLDPPPALKQRTVLHILRIVQEALSNALKHSGARAIVIMASMDARQQTLEVSVTDDGIGLPRPRNRRRTDIAAHRAGHDRAADDGLRCGGGLWPQRLVARTHARRVICLLCWVVILSLYWDSSSLFVLPTMPVWCALATA
jgi:signal transduction histidine kinase